MDFELTDDQKLIRKSVAELMRDFGDEYWRDKDERNAFPVEYYNAIADGGWLGLTIPPQTYGERNTTSPATSVRCG